ncbi:hypothetical protein C7C56_000685 [Massilia glaciei]|uniref:Uncharacterized protein n=1 Tax=Massilia glaciei TaxID=1524097 RepID=A0A2U2I7E1_9BURK|nr:hypothetical protein C7C56_000685 [Massilia glaciei]
MFCRATTYYQAANKQHEYEIGHNGRLYYRSGAGERWTERRVRKQFSANEYLGQLHVGSNGVVYLNTMIIPKDDNSNAPSVHKLYMSRDRGQRWEPISGNASKIKPVNLQMWAIRNNTLLMTCETRQRNEKQLCEALDSNPNRVVITAAKVDSSSLVAGLDGAIYGYQQNEVKQLEPDGKSWRVLGLKGVPESFGELRK